MKKVLIRISGEEMGHTENPMTFIFISIYQLSEVRAFLMAFL